MRQALLLRRALSVINLSQSGERLAFEVFEERAAPGGDVLHFLREAEVLDSFSGFAAADHGHAGRGRERISDCPCAFAEGSILELAHRPVPDRRPGPGDLLLI